MASFTFDSQGNEYYTLETLVFFIKTSNASSNHAQYIRAASEARVQFVRRPDRKDLLAYLNGETAIVTSIDKSAPIPIPVAADGVRNLGSDSLNASASSSLATVSTEDGPPAKIARHNDHEIQKAKEKFSEQLDSRGIRKALPSTAPVASEANSSLAESLSIEKINALKAKRLAKKRNTIIDAESDIGKDVGDGEGEREMLHKADSGQTKEIQSRERVWRDRSTILQSSGKNFYKSVMQILQNIKLQEEGGIKKPTNAVPAPVINTQTGAGGIGAGSNLPSRNMAGAPTGLNASSAIQTQQYNRYDQERFSRLESSIGPFRIDTTGTYHGLTLKSVTEGTLPQPTVGSGPMPPSSKNIGNNGMPGPRVPGGVAGVNPPKKRQSSAKPIIIIPATTTSVITMLNAKSILQDLKYVSPEPDAKRENELLIQRRKGDGTTVPYRVLDNPAKLQGDEWDRVVAVFVQGPAWQFKGWPWGGNPVEIFSHIKAFHLKFDENKLDANVAKWNVEVIELSRLKRHLDRANLLKFWSSLDNFMYKYKHHLRC